MITNEKMIRVDQLVPCPWNPRGEITPESVADLTASIKARGLLQNIGVWKRPDADGYYVIFGNRRYVACVNAMMAEIRCRVFDCSEVEAHEITRIENEARLGVSPIEDARLVGKMINMGYSGKEIAAHFGVSEACVTRRRKLLDLSPGWIGRAAEVDIPTDTLEAVSAYPEEIQDRVLAKISNWALREGWSCVRGYFADATNDLESGFDFPAHDEELLARCKKCGKRTGTQPDLFGDVEGGLGRCLDRKCYKASHAAWVKKLLADAVAPGVTETYQMGPYEDPSNKSRYSDKPQRGRSAAYYRILERKGKVMVTVKYGAGKAEKRAAERMRLAKEQKEEEREKARAKVFSSARSKVAAWAKANDPGAVALLWATVDGAIDPWRLLYVVCVAGLSVDTARLLKDKNRPAYFVSTFKNIKEEMLSGRTWAREILRYAAIMPGLLDDMTAEEMKELKARDYD